MANTITKIGTNGLGVYLHAETGFYLHDVESVKDIVTMNGCFACDMTKGNWAWLAGEDMLLMVYKKGLRTLADIARYMLDKQHYASDNGFDLSVAYDAQKFGSAGSGTNPYAATRMPSLNTRAYACGTDLRLFGIVTNVQAGCGYSTALLDGVVKALVGTPAANRVGVVHSTIPGYEPKTKVADAGRDVTAAMSRTTQSCDYGVSSSAVGRVIVSLPLGDWEGFLKRWAEATPHYDKAEVKQKVDAALSKFKERVLPIFFSVPHIRVPLTIAKDGKAYLEVNQTPSMYRNPYQTVGFGRAWFTNISPTLACDYDGFWRTNPLVTIPGETCYAVTQSTAALGAEFLSCANHDGNSGSARYTMPGQRITEVAGVQLEKILGGLYPRVDTDVIDVTQAELINSVFISKHINQTAPSLTAGQTQEEYDTTATATMSSGYGGQAYNWGHWNLCGQPILAASMVVDLYLQGKTIQGFDAFNMFSGTICPALRVGLGNVWSYWDTCDFETDPSKFFGSQLA